MEDKTKKNLKNAVIATGILLGATFTIMRTIAKKQQPKSVYADQPEEQNPVEGKKVVFVENENEPENADGKCGHLQAVGESEHLPTFYEKYVKRGFDIVLSFGGLVVLAPVYAATALAIKADDPGPVIFKQKRVAQNKGYFQLLKFRSMSVNTPKDVPTHMLQNGGITKVGAFIRKTSIDELPQLWNIFLGNMSIIGPRPALWNQDYLTAERDKYGANDVKPGLTGLAQISGRDELEIEDKAKFDGVYAKELKKGSVNGFLMDVKMFLGSISSVLRSSGVVEGGTGAIAKEKAKVKNLVPNDSVLIERTIPELNICFENQISFDIPSHINVLIVGKDSYIGTHVRDYLRLDSRYTVTEMDTLKNDWIDFDYRPYDIVFQVAGIAHQIETNENAHQYYKINRDLAVEVAKKAKVAGVRHYILMSSMSVYGLEQAKSPINLNTPVNPSTNYGWSKLQAEQKLSELESENFLISYLRPPMVYGKNAPGNLERLYKCIRKFRIFPTLKNERSSISINNICEGIKQVIEKKYTGVVIMQDSEYRCTFEVIKEQMEKENIKVHYTSFCNPLLKMLISKNVTISKVFGDLKYEK